METTVICWGSIRGIPRSKPQRPFAPRSGKLDPKVAEALDYTVLLSGARTEIVGTAPFK